MHDELERPPSDEENERFREAISRVEVAGREVGLYLDKAHVGVHPTMQDDPDPHFLVMAEFNVGDLAFSPRVLDPATENTSQVVRGMDVDMQKAEVEEVRKRLMEGKGPLGDLADDE